MPSWLLRFVAGVAQAGPHPGLMGWRKSRACLSLDPWVPGHPAEGLQWGLGGEPPWGGAWGPEARQRCLLPGGVPLGAGRRGEEWRPLAFELTASACAVAGVAGLLFP